jgi:hypothetical protein
MDILTDVRWSPYAVGIGIGVLSWFTFLVSKHPIGCSTGLSRISGMIEMRSGDGVRWRASPTTGSSHPSSSWEVMLLVGIVIGALVSALLSGDFQVQWVSSTWEDAFGANAFLRVAVALLGGVIIGFGARWAGGCTSGHGISGTLQLDVASWISVVFFFVGGILTANLIFRVIA